MPHVTRLRKVGGSVMLTIPPALLDALDLKPDAAVGVTIEAGKLLVEPGVRPRYTLRDLLAEAEGSAPATDDDREWVDTPALGRELI